MQRLLEGRVRHRSLVWAYLTALVAIAAATVLLLAALLVRYLPHEYLVRAGLSCIEESGVCAASLPPWVGPPYSFLMGGVIGGLILYFVATVCSQLGLSRCHQAGLSRVARADREVLTTGRSFQFPERLVVLENSTPTSYTIGFLRPQVVVSTGLSVALEEEEVTAVLAHEEAHVVGYDNVILLVAQSLGRTFALVPGARRALARLRRAQEIAADEYAREKTGDGLVVASGLEKFARSVSPAPLQMVGVSAFAEGTGVTERIWGLLTEPELILRSRRYVIAVVAGLLLIFSIFTGSALAFTEVSVDTRGACSGCHMSSHGDGAARAAHGDCCVRF